MVGRAVRHGDRIGFCDTPVTGMCQEFGGQPSWTGTIRPALPIQRSGPGTRRAARWQSHTLDAPADNEAPTKKEMVSSCLLCTLTFATLFAGSWLLSPVTAVHLAPLLLYFTVSFAAITGVTLFTDFSAPRRCGRARRNLALLHSVVGCWAGYFDVGVLALVSPVAFATAFQLFSLGPGTKWLPQGQHWQLPVRLVLACSAGGSLVGWCLGTLLRP